MNLGRENLVWLRYAALAIIAVNLFAREDPSMGWFLSAAIAGGAVVFIFLRRK